MKRLLAHKNPYQKPNSLALSKPRFKFNSRKTNIHMVFYPGDIVHLRTATEKALFNVRKILGRGNFGTVFEAQDIKTGEKVAVKTAVLQKYRDALRHEFDISRPLEHANILGPLFLYTSTKKYTYESQPTVFLGMPVMLGSMFDLFLNEASYLRIDIKELAHLTFFNMVKELFSGLAYLESRGILHLDIKPENLLLEKNFRVKIADFGLAKHVTKLGTNTYKASRYYRAPELAFGVLPIGSEVDVWSAGCVVAELLFKQVTLPAKCNTKLQELTCNLLGPLPPHFTGIEQAPENHQHMADTAYASKTVNRILRNMSSVGQFIARNNAPQGLYFGLLDLTFRYPGPTSFDRRRPKASEIMKFLENHTSKTDNA